MSLIFRIILWLQIPSFLMRTEKQLAKLISCEYYSTVVVD